MDSSLLEIGFKMSVALGVVLITFGAAVWVAKKFFGASLPGSGGRKDALSGKTQLKVETTRVLGQGRNLHVLRFGSKVLLVGATNHNISLISEVSFDEDAEAEESFETSLQANTEENRNSSIRDQIGSRLREIARV
jgi:flagellar biogenesis protein FliO